MEESEQKEQQKEEEAEGGKEQRLGKGTGERQSTWTSSRPGASSACNAARCSSVELSATSTCSTPPRNPACQIDSLPLDCHWTAAGLPVFRDKTRVAQGVGGTHQEVPQQVGLGEGETFSDVVLRCASTVSSEVELTPSSVWSG
jgi:hypothetical protein